MAAFVLKHTFWLIQFVCCSSFAITIQSHFYLSHSFCRHPICVYTAAEKKKYNLIYFKVKNQRTYSTKWKLIFGKGNLTITITLRTPSSPPLYDDRFGNYPHKWAPSLSAGCESSLSQWQSAVEGFPFYSWALSRWHIEEVNISCSFRLASIHFFRAHNGLWMFFIVWEVYWGHVIYSRANLHTRSKCSRLSESQLGLSGLTIYLDLLN